MKNRPTNRVLLLSDGFPSLSALCAVTQRAGLALDLEQASSRDEFLAQFQGGPPALVLVNIGGLATISLAEVLNHARSLKAPVPVVVIGGGPESEVRHHSDCGHSDNEIANQATAIAAHETLDAKTADFIYRGAVDYVPLSELARLPLIIERILRDGQIKVDQADLRLNRERAAQVLRDNQKLVAAGRLAASIAHEINNPLESISNLLYLLHAEAGLSQDAATYLSLAQKELERVVQISKQTLSFHRETPNAVRVQPADLLEDAIALYVRKLEEKQLKVIRQYKSREFISLFPGEMRQVFSNLIANAIEASEPNGTLWLRIRKGRQWSDRGIEGLRISVGDSGSGVAGSARHRIGEPFFTTKGQAGTGLGLWVTQSILRRHGGFLQLHSSTAAQRHGTVVSVFLPTNMGPRPVQNPAGGPSSGMANVNGAAGPDWPSAGETAGHVPARTLASGF